MERIGVPQIGVSCMDAGGLPVFPSANQAHQLANNHHLQQQRLHLQQQQQHIPNPQQQQQQLQQHRQLEHLQQQGLVQDLQQQYNQQQQADPTQAKQKVADRLRRRLDGYRQRQSECEPRFEQTFSGVCEQQNFETTVLQKRFLENKARKAKKPDKKPDTTLAGNLQSSVHLVSNILKAFFICFFF